MFRNRGSSLGFCSFGFLVEVVVSFRSFRRRIIKFKDVDRGE